MYVKGKKMFGGLIVVVALSLFFAGVSHGQERNKEGGGMGYFMFGGSVIDIKGLNAMLEDRERSKIPANFISIGGGGHRTIGRVIVGGEGHGLIGEEVTSRGYRKSIEAGYGLFNLGYVVHSTENLRVYPLLGLGGGGITLNMVEIVPYSSFGDVLTNPERGVELSTSGFLLNLALGIDHLLSHGRGEKGRGGLILGLRAGYIFTPIKGGWEMAGVGVHGGPDVGITGPYIRLMIGGGGFW